MPTVPDTRGPTVKTAQAFHICLGLGLQSGGLAAVLGELGLQAQTLENTATVVQPALVLLYPGQKAPEGLEEMALAPPKDASRTALRELLRIAMENVALKHEVKQLEEQAHRLHRQFEELNRIGVALSAERDITKLQEFILTTLRQLTNADTASLWRKTLGEDGSPQLFLASSQKSAIGNTHQAFTVPVDEKSLVGYTVTVGWSQIYDDAHNPPPDKPQGGRNSHHPFGYR